MKEQKNEMNECFCSDKCMSEASRQGNSTLPGFDLQLFASNYKGGAPSHILFTKETEEYITRSFYDNGKGFGSGPAKVRQSGRLQNYSYVTGPFWSGGGSDLLNLADYITEAGRDDFLCNGFESVPVSFPCAIPDTGNCNSYDVSFGKEHDASCKGGKMLKLWEKCIRFNSLMGKLQKILSHKGYKIYKDWSNFGLASQKMIWWLKLKR